VSVSRCAGIAVNLDLFVFEPAATERVSPALQAPGTKWASHGRDRLRVLQHWRFYDARTPTVLPKGKPKEIRNPKSEIGQLAAR